VGKEFEIPKDKKLKCCPDDKETEGGLHFCENPLDVFGYYSPADSKFAEVEGRGEVEKHIEDSKVATSRLFIKAEITLSQVVGMGVKFILDRVNFKDAKESESGNRSAATNTGDRSAAIVEGRESVAISTGLEGKAKGKIGCWIVLAEWTRKRDGWHIVDVKSFPVDGSTIKEDIFYSLKNGVAIEVQ